jgi:hypothetical protein
MNTSRPPGRSSPGRLGDPPIGIAPDRGTISADHQIGAAGAQRHPLGVRLNQRKPQAELALHAARDGQLVGRDVHPDRARPRWASHAETYPLPQPNSTATSPARSAGNTGNRDWGMRQIPQYGSAAAHRERAYRSNQADMCSSHCRRVTATCPPVLLGSGLQSIP